MHRFVALPAVLLLGCSSPASAPYAPPDAASSTGVQPASDGGVAVDLGDAAPTLPLWQPCASSNDCEPGWTCYDQHTAPAWGLYDGGDVFGHCTIATTCYEADSFRCNAADGTCACPMRMDGTYPNCQPGTEGLDEKALVCVPIPR